ncbi:hypothetical protein [Neorhizobium sp. IRS_2294]|uniref:hypothetical protein n=1 Tax=unclassified Neorhizobium TaxID=2629175 RepID=UPI003D2CF953
MTAGDGPRKQRIRRNNMMLLAVLVAFVLAVFSNSFFHIRQEARPAAAAGERAPP